jgi:hypothetical protein
VTRVAVVRTQVMPVVVSLSAAGPVAHAPAMAGHPRQAVLDASTGRTTTADGEGRRTHAATPVRAVMTIGLLLSPAVAALLMLTPRDRAGPGCRHRFLQCAQPPGHVVSPLDAVLDATGAIGVGTLTAHVRLVRGQP